MKKKTILTGLLIFTFIGILFATTWYETKVKCPVCKTKNTFQQIGSYGGYIYGWPSKYQYIYWPVTETYSVYSCSNCRYSAFMWDFEDISGDTLQLIKSAIDTLSITMKAKKDYTKIPISEKLETAELFYKLYQTDLDFWCRFHRIKGYHYEEENITSKANASRLIALDIADSILTDTFNNYRKKELLLITGAMRHFTGQDSLALIDFENAKSFVYNDPKSDSSNNSGMNDYLDALLVDYENMINNPEE
ncbi:DUF2225 domain-containing protein [Labilibacter sediminis]|nr:DUF2225 domain-containing protein [Labilibacter sediminis]